MVNKCKFCGGALRPGQNFCFACGKAQHSEPVEMPKPGKKNGKRLTALAAACAVTVLLASSVVFHWPVTLLRSNAAEAPAETVNEPGQNAPEEPAVLPALLMGPAGTPDSPKPETDDPVSPETGDPVSPETVPEDEQAESVEEGTAPEPTDEATPSPTSTPAQTPAPTPTPTPTPTPAPESKADVAEPTVTAHPAHQAVVVNDTARFSVKAEGSGLTYQWQYCTPDDERFCEDEPNWRNITAGTAGFGGVNTAELTVTATSARNGCSYRCAVSNAGGTVYSQRGTLYSCDRRLGSGLYWTLVGPDDYSGNKTAAFAGTGAIPDYPYPDDEGNGSPWSDDIYLGRVVLAPGVTGVGSCAFTNCWNLHQVTFPDSVTSIGDRAFASCFYNASGSSTYSVTIPAGVTRIGDRAFAECGGLSAIRVESGNRVYSSADGVLYNRAKTELIQVPGGYRGSLTIPKSVTTIARGAMSRCGNLTAVTIPDSVTAIGRDTFQYCEGLTEIKIPKGVREIGDYTFFYCKNLSEITIPDSVETIGYRAFCECKYMSAVHIGSGVKSIGQYAFQSCPCLTDVYYNGTQEGWNAISIASGNQSLLNATLHLK